jgi:hypothetical protein
LIWNLVCFVTQFSFLSSTHDTAAQSILAEIYVYGKEFISGPNAFMRKNVFMLYSKAKKQPEIKEVTVQMKKQTAT